MEKTGKEMKIDSEKMIIDNDNHNKCLSDLSVNLHAKMQTVDAAVEDNSSAECQQEGSPAHRLPLNAHSCSSALSPFQAVPYDYIQCCLWNVLSTRKNSMEAVQPIGFLHVPPDTLVEQHTSEEILATSTNHDEIVEPLSSDEIHGVEELAVSTLLGRESKWLNSLRVAAELRYNHLIARIYGQQQERHFQNHPHMTSVVVQKSTESENIMPSTPGIERKYQCPECSYQCDSRWHMTRHITSVHSSSKPFYCYICGLEFSRSEKVKGHFQRKHPTVTYDISKVRRSSLSTPAKSPLALSPEKETSIKTHSVNVCNISPMPLQDLSSPGVAEDNHSMNGVGNHAHAGNPANQLSPDAAITCDVGENTSQSDKKPVSCPFCPYTCKDFWHLRRHVSNVHSDKKEFNCPSCDYATNRRHRLVSHMKNHGKLYCSFCSFSSSNTNEYEDHYKVCSRETKKADFACDDCQLSFANRRLFREHMYKSHSINLFCCDLCLFWTPSADQYQIHRETHRRSSLSLNDSLSPAKQGSMNTQPSVAMALSQPQVVIPMSVMLQSCINHDDANMSVSEWSSTQMHASNGTSVRVSPEQGADLSCVTLRHGRGAFQCPYCPERQPFIYKKSFDKHMASHSGPSMY